MILISYEQSGRITNVNTVWPPGYTDMLAAQGHPFVIAEPPGDDIWTYMVEGGALVPRPACPATVTVSGRTITLANVPEGSTVSVEIEGEIIPTEDTVIELDEAGPLTVTIAAPWPYLEARHDLDIE